MQSNDKKKRLTIPCLSSLSARAPNPGNAKATKTAAIPPFPSASKIFLIVSGLSKSPCTNSNNASTGSLDHFRLSKDLEDDAPGFRVRARIRKLERKKREETTARPCRPVAPTTRTVFGGLVGLLPLRLVDIWKMEDGKTERWKWTLRVHYHEAAETIMIFLTTLMIE